MGTFNIKKAPSEAVIESDSFDNFLGADERTKYLEIPSENLSDGGVASLYILPSAFDELNEHIGWKTRTSHNSSEQGGILVGSVYKDRTTQLICGVVHHIIPSKKTGNATYIQFTHEDWILMYKEFEGKYASITDENGNKRLNVIGWYHTHPNMPVYMSGIDKGTHLSFFPADWQFSIIFNPQRGIWAVFNGNECKSCNGFIYCTYMEERCQEMTEGLDDGLIMQSKNDEKAGTNQIAITKNSFVIKSRSYRTYNAQERYLATGQNVSSVKFEHQASESVPSSPQMRQQYKGTLLQSERTCYYCPINIKQISGTKRYVIGNNLVEKFGLLIGNWEFRQDESIALIYNLNEGKVPVKVSTEKYYTFQVPLPPVDGFVFKRSSSEFIEYKLKGEKKTDVSLVVVYSVKKTAYAELCEMYGNYDCALWINPCNANEFEFYSFASNSKSTKSNFNIKKRYVWEAELDIKSISEQLSGWIKNLTTNQSFYGRQPTSYYLAENNSPSQGQPPLMIDTKILTNLLQPIRYREFKNYFSVVISYNAASRLCMGNQIIFNWENELICIQAFGKNESNYDQRLSLKNLDGATCSSKLSNIALIISNRDIDIYSFRNNLTGHLAAICLNIKTNSCNFYRLN